MQLACVFRRNSWRTSAPLFRSDRLKEQEAKMEKVAAQIEMSTLGLQIAQLP
jgi:hypothetical protein